MPQRLPTRYRTDDPGMLRRDLEDLVRALESRQEDAVRTNVKLPTVSRRIHDATSVQAEFGSVARIAPRAATTITLPRATAADAGLSVGIERTAGSSAVTVVPVGIDVTIDGGSTWTLPVDLGIYWLFFDGTVWSSIGSALTTETTDLVTATIASLVPVVNTYTSDDTWTKPSNAVWVDFIVVGGGYSGGDADYDESGGAGGGSSGAFVSRSCPTALVPASLFVRPGAAGEFSEIYSEASPPQQFVIRTPPGSDGADSTGATGASGGTCDGVPAAALAADGIGSDGGDGGDEGVAGSTGSRGMTGEYGAAGAAGTGNSVGTGGGGGRGDGAGGGGAGGGSIGGTVNGGGGGGGAGGYGYAALASAGENGKVSTGTASGGAGAAGVVIVTTWVDPS